MEDDGTVGHTSPNEVMVDINVLGVAVINRISGQKLSSTVVNEKGHGLVSVLP